MIKAIIFDCFGVFYEDPVFAYIRDTSNPREIANALHELDKQAAVGKLNKSDFIYKASLLLGVEKGETEKRFFVGRNRNDTLLGFAQQLRKKYKIGLLSNIGSDMMDGFFSVDEQHEFFDDVVLSGEVKICKPNPSIFALACSRLGVHPNEAIMVDDSSEFVDSARTTGMNAIRYTDYARLRTGLDSFLKP